MASYEDRGNNSYRLTVEAGYDTEGERLRERKTIKFDHKPKESEILMELAKFQIEVEDEDYVKPNKMSFKNFTYNEWKPNYADMNLGEYTRFHYMAIITTHLLPTFGSMQLSQIKTMHIVNFMTKLRTPEGRKDGRDKPLATATILNIFKTLKSILDSAKKWNVISKNPMDGVDRPRVGKAEKKAIKAKKMTYSKEEVLKAILALLQEPEHWCIYYLGAMFGGYRRGEITAMEWHQVDQEKGGLHVENQATFDQFGKPMIGPVKTEESEAFVPMPKWYMSLLKEYYRTWLKEKLLCKNWLAGEKKYVFKKRNGLLYYPNTPSMTWGKLLKRHNLPQIPLHGLRHTVAKLLRNAGADMKSIQELLRHTMLATTSDIYTEKSEVMGRSTADLLEEFDPKLLRRPRVVPKARN